MKYTLSVSLASILLLTACGETTEKYFPRTTAGLESGGIVGAVEGFTGGVAVICQNLDGEEFMAAVNSAAEAFGVMEQTETARELRQGVCDKAAAVANVAEAWAAVGVVAVEAAAEAEE